MRRNMFQYSIICNILLKEHDLFDILICMDKLEALTTYFGYHSFRKGQEEVIDALLSGRDTLAVMPTGAGKSVCYQIPALMFEGMTMVISPLISLMKDQVQALNRNGIPAAYLNSTLTPAQYEKALDYFILGRYKIVYVAPERIVTNRFLHAVKQVNISFVAVDEAHCISHWGQNFRPDYLKIHDFVEQLPERPLIGAFTATATEAVKQDIVSRLELIDPFCLTTGFDRENLHFSVLRPKNKDRELLKLVRERREKKGIVYCGTRNATDEVCGMLNAHGIKAVRYHAGMTEADRHKAQDDFVYDRMDVITATSAFGMGIDKPDVAFVIHYQMPLSLEEYYQEAGRAGRDGERAECILLYDEEDYELGEFLINRSHSAKKGNVSKEAKKNDFDKLDKMRGYCLQQTCLRHTILKYFGEESPSYCGNCSCCASNYVEKDITVPAQKVLSCIVRAGQKYNAETIVDILLGKNNNEIIRNDSLDTLSTFGIMDDFEKRKVMMIIEGLTQKGYISLNEDVLVVTQKAKPVLLKMENVTMPVVKGYDLFDVDASLFHALKDMRKYLAEKESVPAYVVFSDATLRDIARKKPQTLKALKSISGIGKHKAKKYGEYIIAVVKSNMLE